MKGPYITKAEIAVIEKLHAIWEKLESSKDKLKASKAASLSSTICAAVPKLILEVKRLRNVEGDLNK
jgi:hypothetical protein